MLKILGMTACSGKSVQIFLTIGSELLLHHDPISFVVVVFPFS